MRKSFVLTALFVPMLMSACAGRYQAPTTSVTPPASMVAEDTTAAAFEAAWWQQFQEPALDRLVEEARPPF